MRFCLQGFLFVLAGIPLMATPIEATFVGVNGTLGFGYYVGPYYGNLGPQSVVFDCVDFANDVYFGQQWAANLSPIETQAGLADTRYGGIPNALQLYQEAAWLTGQYALNPQSDYDDIQATIWQLFDSYSPAPSSNYWLTQAQANYASGDYSNFFVVTNLGPVNPTGQVQEFLTVLNPSMSIYPVNTSSTEDTDGVILTPEPALMGTLGLALISIAVFIRWRKSRSRHRVTAKTEVMATDKHG